MQADVPRIMYFRTCKLELIQEGPDSLGVKR